MEISQNFVAFSEYMNFTMITTHFTATNNHIQTSKQILVEFVLFSDADFLKQITIDKLSSKSYEPYYDDLFYGPVMKYIESFWTADWEKITFFGKFF